MRRKASVRFGIYRSCALASAASLAILAAGSCRQEADRPEGAGAAGPAPSAPAPWPEAPVTAPAAQALIEARALRRPRPSQTRDLAPDAVADRLARLETVGVAAGWEGITRALTQRFDRARRQGRDGYLLVGCYHDSGLQVEAFRRLVGSDGVRGLTLVALEQLRAGGRWRGVPERAQRGDGGDLRSYLTTGDAGAWSRLRSRQLRGDYAAWRYGYVDQIMDVIEGARAQGRALMGCDMPAALQSRLGAVGHERLDRLREIHCTLAVSEAGLGAAPRRIAMLWGRDHLDSNGLRRFLPAKAEVLSVYLVGGRQSPFAPEARLATSLVVNDPILVPLDPASGHYALVIPGPRLGGAVERSRITADPGSERETAGMLRVSSERPGRFEISGREIEVAEGEVARPLPEGPGVYLFESEDRRTVGLLESWGRGGVELTFDPATKATRIIYFDDSTASSSPSSTPSPRKTQRRTNQ